MYTYIELEITPTEPVSPDEDSESVCSSLDGGSIYSEDGGPLVGGGEDVGESEEDVQFQLLEHIDQLGDKRCVSVCVCTFFCLFVCLSSLSVDWFVFEVSARSHLAHVQDCQLSIISTKCLDKRLSHNTY